MNRGILTLRAVGALLTLLVLAVLAVAVAHGTPTEGRAGARMPTSPGVGMGTSMGSMAPMHEGVRGGEMHDAMHATMRRMMHGTAVMHGAAMHDRPAGAYGLGGMHGVRGPHPMSFTGPGAPGGADRGVAYAHGCANMEPDVPSR